MSCYVGATLTNIAVLQCMYVCFCLCKVLLFNKEKKKKNNNNKKIPIKCIQKQNKKKNLLQLQMMLFGGWSRNSGVQ